jgi:uncharacterized protein
MLDGNKHFALIFAGICVAVFFVQIAIPVVTDIFVLQSSDVLVRPWILVTSIFLHGGIEHLLYNMIALVVFGMILESIIGSKKFVTIFFVTGIIASICSSFFYNAALGASGAIFGLLGTLAVLRPRMTVWVYSVPMPMFVAAGAWLVIDLLGVLYPSGTANVAHIAGLLFGAAVGFYMRKQYPGEQRKWKKEKVLSDDEINNWEDRYMK